MWMSYGFILEEILLGVLQKYPLFWADFQQNVHILLNIIRVSIFQKKFHACPHSSSSLSCVPFPTFFFPPSFFLIFLLLSLIDLLPSNSPKPKYGFHQAKMIIYIFFFLFSFSSSLFFFLVSFLPYFAQFFEKLKDGKRKDKSLEALFHSLSFLFLPLFFIYLSFYEMGSWVLLAPTRLKKSNEIFRHFWHPRRKRKWVLLIWIFGFCCFSWLKWWVFSFLCDYLTWVSLSS